MSGSCVPGWTSLQFLLQNKKDLRRLDLKSLEAKLLEVKEAISRLDSEGEIRVQRSLNFCSKKWLRPLGDQNDNFAQAT